MKAYVVYEKHLITADTFQELAKKLAQDIKYHGIGMSDFEVPNIKRTEENDPKQKLWDYAYKLLKANRDAMLAVTFEDICDDQEKFSKYFDLYFKCVDAGLEQDSFWTKAITNLGSELQI